MIHTGGLINLRTSSTYKKISVYFLRVTVLEISSIKQKNKGKSSTQVVTSTLKIEPTVSIELQQNT